MAEMHFQIDIGKYGLVAIGLDTFGADDPADESGASEKGEASLDLDLESTVRLSQGGLGLGGCFGAREDET